MKKLRLVLVDKDLEYIQLFANYIRSSDYATRFDVKLFSQEDSFQKYLDSKEHTDIVLTSSENDESLKNYPHIETVLYLSDKLVEDPPDGNTVYKYQQIGQLIQQILTSHYERNGKTQKTKVKSNEETKILSFFSPAGGTGKTTTAYHLAKELKGHGLEIFYLNLELINANPLLFDVDNQTSSSPLLYYLKTNTEQLQEKIKENTVVDNETSIHFFHFIPNAEEMYELYEQETTLLLEKLVQNKDYDYIIVDLESALNERVMAALKTSDHVFWLLNNDMYSFHKTSYLLEEMHGFLNDGSFSDHTSVVLNRYMGSVDPRLADYGIEIDAYLPYIPEWKQLVSRNRLNNSPVFNEYVERMFRKYAEAGGVVHGSG